MNSNALTVGSRYRYVVGASLLFLNVAMGMSFLSPAPLFPRIVHDLGVDNATVSLLIGIPSLAIALLLIAGSVISAKLGAKRSLIVGGILISSGMLSPLAGNFAALAATRVLFACGVTLVLSSTPTVVMRWFSAKELAAVNGLNVMGQSIGVTTSMFAGPRIAASGGWATALFTFGAVAAIATVLWVILGRDSANADDEAPPPFPIRALPAMLTDRPTIILGLGVAGALGTFITFTSWLPTYWQEVFKFSPEQAGTTSAVLGLFGIAGSALGSTLPARFPRRRPFLILSGVLLPVFAAGCFLVNSPLILLASVPIFGILGWVFMPVVFTIPMELPNMTSERVGVAVAIVLSAANLSGFVFPLLVGFLRDLTGGFTLAFSVCALLALALAGAGYLMPETGMRHVDTSKLVTAETIEATSL